MSYDPEASEAGRRDGVATDPGANGDPPAPNVLATVSDLPRGWQRVRVSDIGHVRLGRQRAPQHHTGPHMRPYLRVANVYEDRLDLSDVLEMNFDPWEYEVYRLAPGDILLNEGQSLELVGRPAMYRGEVPEACFQNTLVRFRASPAVDPGYALIVFRGYLHTGQFQQIATRTVNIAHLGATRFAYLWFPLPPLAEQKRIVAEAEKQFSRLDAGVAALKRVQANLKRYRAAVLQAACEGRLVPTEAELARAEGREYEPAEVLIKRAAAERRSRWNVDADVGSLPPLPEGWSWATWDQLAARVTVGYVGPMKHEYVNDGVPFLRSQNVRENRFDPNGLCYISGAFHARITKSALRPGDLVVVRSGSVGVTCAIPENLTEANCSDLVVIQQPRGVLPRYGSYWMNSLARRFVKAGRVGITLTHFNTQSVATLPVAVPPLAEQRRIVGEAGRRLSDADEVEAMVKTSLRRADRLRRAILKRAFEGKLVPQDPEDEPASVLLERIRADRTAMNGAAAKSRRSRVRRKRGQTALDLRV